MFGVYGAQDTDDDFVLFRTPIRPVADSVLLTELSLLWYDLVWNVTNNFVAL